VCVRWCPPRLPRARLVEREGIRGVEVRFEDWVVEMRMKVASFRVKDSGFRVQGFGFRV